MELALSFSAYRLVTLLSNDSTGLMLMDISRNERFFLTLKRVMDDTILEDTTAKVPLDLKRQNCFLE